MTGPSDVRRAFRAEWTPRLEAAGLVFDDELAGQEQWLAATGAGGRIRDLRAFLDSQFRRRLGWAEERPAAAVGGARSYQDAGDFLRERRAGWERSRRADDLRVTDPRVLRELRLGSRELEL